MRTSNSLRWLVVVAGAAMLLMVAAACSSETVEVPGETVVVEKVVTETVEVPGETVVVEKEVIKTVEVPGETVTKEVIKEVMVPGETVVVEKEVVKTVEVPGQTVVKEVVKTVEVPGQTVVVEKEVVKTVEVPGQTVVVEKVVVQEVPGKNYVTDPTTGKAVSAPQYGGTITYAVKAHPVSIDPYFRYESGFLISPVNEKLGIADWGIDRDVFDFRTIYLPEIAVRGALAESWEVLDDTTYVFHIRQGVHWHDKPPMNGRELTAKDIEYNYHRILGLGSGFTEPGVDVAATGILGKLSFESITATDKWTVVFKLKEPVLGALKEILQSHSAYILAPEVIEQHGDVADWENVVGTGPFTLTDFVEQSSITYAKNPNYWGFDEKYPENRLPYIDKLTALVMPEWATQLAALRSAKVDVVGFMGSTQIISIDQVKSLQRTNPEIALYSYSYRAETGLAVNVQIEPWNDVRVRTAITMAIDLEAINEAYFGGWADPTPSGTVGKNVIGYRIPFEEWPEEVKKGYMYDPEGAERLLDEAGYPRGADGVRIRTVYDHYANYDLDYYLLVMDYLRAIGIETETKINERPVHLALVREHRNMGIIGTSTAFDYSPPINTLTSVWGKSGYSPSNAQDPAYDALYEAASGATTVEEQQRLIKEADMYQIRQHWHIPGPRVPSFQATWPWVIGYNGETELGGMARPLLFSRLWIDQELKEAMGY